MNSTFTLCIYNIDCFGICGGTAVEDECGICGGSGPVLFYDCNGICVNDEDFDGVCDELEIPGCTDPVANNYNPEATDDDGSCVYPVTGCTDPDACNYNPEAKEEDGSCIYPQEYYLSLIHI